MITDNIKNVAPVIEIMYNGASVLSTGRFCVREAGVKYGVANDNAVWVSIKEVNGRKYVDVDLSAEIQKRLSNAADAKEEERIVRDYVLRELRGEYHTPDGRIVDITRRGAKKITNGAPVIKLRVTPYLAQLIETGRFQRIIDANHKTYKQFAFYDAVFKIGNNWYGGTLNIGVREDDTSSLYDINPFTKIEEVGAPGWVSNLQAKKP